MSLKPPRLAFGDNERDAVEDCLDWYALRGLDPAYAGEFERRYCSAFAAYQGGGFADAVATGTAALFVAIRALDLPPLSEVVVSPVTDPGTLAAIVLNGHRPRVVDSEGDFAISRHKLLHLGKATKAALIVHPLGRAAEAVAYSYPFPVIEDCSQAHGALWGHKRVGTFGAIAAFSTMARKAHITGGCGGVVYTQDEALHRRALAHADRGKPVWKEGFNDRDPRTFLFSALNLHSNELACAIGCASLARLEETRQRRLAFLDALCLELSRSHALTPNPYTHVDSPFVFPLWVRKGVDKHALGEALTQAGIGLNPSYEAYLVRDWPWLAPHLPHDQADTPNARTALASSLMLYLNENYTTETAKAIVDTICNVEKAFL